jgi:hypothetical protein
VVEHRRRVTAAGRLGAAVGLAALVACSSSVPDSPPRHVASAPPADVECGWGSFEAGHWPTACWRPYADDSPFNTRVPRDPRLDPESDRIVEAVLGMGPIADLVDAPDTGSDWYHPVYFSSPRDPVHTVHCTRDWGTCEVEGARVRIPDGARPAGGGDAHMAVVDQQTGVEYDLWQAEQPEPGGGTLTVSWGGRTTVTGSGLGSDATAAHFGLLAGVIRAAELKAGHIDHALFMTVGCTAHRYVYPAAGYASDCDDESHAPAVGQWFWLDMTRAEIEALGAPPWKETILRALADYGAYVGDTGGTESFGFHFESGSTYTSFGEDDPMAAFARAQSAGVTDRGDRFDFDLGSGVDWASHLRVLDPCMARGTCETSNGSPR